MPEASRNATVRKPKRKISNLERAADLIRKEADNLSNSTAPSILRRLEQIASELDAIEGKL